MHGDLSGGLVYIIVAIGGEDEVPAARAIGRRLISAARSAAMSAGGPGAAGGPEAQGEAKSLPGILWGFVPFRPDGAGPGDRLSYAAREGKEVVLRGDPVWREALSGRPCTAAVLLDVWGSQGAVGAARALDNMSLALLSDANTGELHVLTDRMGGISLYRANVDGFDVFASSYLALSKLVPRREIDGDALACFFHLGYFPDRRTALRAVSVHPHATATRIRAGRVTTERYWHPHTDIGSREKPDAQLESVLEAFNGTVREYAAGHQNMLLAMTAGLDSRTVVSSLLHQSIPFQLYTHGFPDCWEGRRVQSIVRRHALPHRFLPLAEEFTSRLDELSRESFRCTEGTISAIEKSHLIHVQSLLREATGPQTALLLGGGAGMLKGTFYRLLAERDRYAPSDVAAYLRWNFTKKLPAIFAPEVPATSSAPLDAFVVAALEECGSGTFFQRLDYLYLVRYRRWAGGVKHIYRHFFPTREPFISARLLEVLFALDPAIKKAQQPHYEILSANFPALQFDLTNKMTPALPLNWRTAHRFLPSLGWRAKQVMRGFSRRFLPWELFPLVDYVDYSRWIGLASGRRLLEELLDPSRMQSAVLYDGPKLRAWLDRERERGWSSFPLLDKMCTLEMYFREISPP